MCLTLTEDASVDHVMGVYHVTFKCSGFPDTHDDVTRLKRRIW